MNGTNYEVPHYVASLLGSNIRLRILFSNTLSLHSSLNVRDHVSQPYSFEMVATFRDTMYFYVLGFLVFPAETHEHRIHSEIPNNMIMQ